MIRPTRRHFLKTATALGAASIMTTKTSATPTLPILRATQTTAQLTPEGYPKTKVWAYAMSGKAHVPGPEIRVMAGERVRYRLQNDLPEPTAVHWHGIRNDNAMDGAAPLTQAPVPPGGRFDYDFVAPDPGTFWYHSHTRSAEQVARGLAGPLIVEDLEPWLGEPGAASREMTLVLDDWLLNSDAEIIEDRWDNLHAAAHAGRLGNTATINGQAYPEIVLRPNERLRLRLINCATARIMRLAFRGVAAHLIALDGHPVAPRASDTLVLGPAQRADIVIDAPLDTLPEFGIFLDPGNGEWVDIARFALTGDPLAQASKVIRPLPAWENLPKPDLTNPQRETLLMDGGAMRGIQQATYKGEALDGRALAQKGMVWAFNGTAHGMAAPMFRAPLGRTIQMEMTNRTAFSHAIHLHGHHFNVLSRNGVRAPHRHIRDTVLIDPEETLEIAFVADNPGPWMLHCHMLAHQAAGMMAWFEVS